jgi:hypothetical protein
VITVRPTLVHLGLSENSHSGYISPGAMATCLSVTRLENLVIRFESPRSCPDRKGRRPPLPTRALLPKLLTVLTGLWFFSHQLIFNTPHLTHFISRTPKFDAPDGARVVFSCLDVSVVTFGGALKLAISRGQSEWHLSCLAQVCNSSFLQALVSAVERLYIREDRRLRLRWQDDIESSQWLEPLHPFTAVKDLYVSREFVPRIALALKELVGE